MQFGDGVSPIRIKKCPAPRDRQVPKVIKANPVPKAYLVRTDSRDNRVSMVCLEPLAGTVFRDATDFPDCLGWLGNRDATEPMELRENRVPGDSRDLRGNLARRGLADAKEPPALKANLDFPVSLPTLSGEE